MADISSIKLPNGNSYNFKDATVRNTISNLALKDTYITENKALDNISVSKTTSDGQGYTTKTLSVSKSGYTAIGITGHNIANASTNGVGSSYCRLVRVYLSNSTTATMFISNDGGDAAVIKVTIAVLYKKN